MSVSVSNSEVQRTWTFEDYEAIDAAVLAKRARLAQARAEVQSYFALDGQSVREDYHREIGHLVGMQLILRPDWSNAYTTFEKLAFALNRVVNEAEGTFLTNERTVVIQSEPFPCTMFTLVPLRQVQAALNVVGFLAGQPVTLPSWRIEKAESGQVLRSYFDDRTRPAKPGEPVCRVQREVQVTRPTVEVRHQEKVPAPPVWANPYQLDGGFTFLADTEHHNLRRPGCEGLTVLVDKDERFHLVHWITEAFAHTRIGRNGKAYRSSQVAKRPLAVHSFPIPTTADDALEEMSRVAEAMAAAGRYLDDPVQDTHLLPWQAAAMVATEEPSTSVPTITGSLEWLTLVADQRTTGETYRPRGALADA